MHYAARMTSSQVTAVGYVRKSNEPGVENRSLEVQRAWIEETAEGLGASLEVVYEDVRSGWLDGVHLPGREQLVERIRRGGVGVVLVYALDRLGRRLHESATVVDECRRAKAQLLTAQASHDLEDPSTIVLTGITAAIAEQESARLSQRIRRDFAKRRAQGGWTGGPPPFGWRIGERGEDGLKRLVLHEDEGPVLREMCQRRLRGESISQITDWLRHGGHQTRAGHPWSYQRVQEALRHPVLAGYMTLSPRKDGRQDRRGREVVLGPDGKPVMVAEPVLKPEEWERLQRLMALQPRERQGTGRGSKLLLSGIVFCGECGYRLVGSRSAQAYRCTSRHSGKADCPGVAIRYPSLHLFVRELVATALEDVGVREAADGALRASQASRAGQDKEGISEALEGARGALEACNEALRDAPPSVVSTLVERARQEEGRVVELESALAALEAGSFPHVPALTGEEFLTLPEEDAAAAVRALVRRIEVKADSGAKGSVPGLFGSAGLNLSRLRVWLFGDEEPRLPSGHTLAGSNQSFECPDCPPGRTFRYEENLRHHRRYQHASMVPCGVCSEQVLLPGLPSHMRAQHPEEEAAH